MKLQSQIPLQKEKNQIDYNSKLLLLGSCFVENIGGKLEYYKFQTAQNPFGILFHPLAIENLITRAVISKEYTEQSVFLHNEHWHCFDAHSDLSDSSKEKLLENLNAAVLQTQEQLTKATHIIITLGTAWVYRKTDTNTTVANCHKVPQKEFSKELLTITEIQASLENTRQSIHSINPKAQIIYTVSPVRHLKDGFVENQRSKARLISALHPHIGVPPLGARGLYFPSYEIMMDELRDYRFYKEDMMHPNDLAVSYIWEKFAYVWITDDAQEVMDKINVVQKGLAHRPFNKGSKEHKYFLETLKKKKTHLEERYPFMKFNT